MGKVKGNTENKRERDDTMLSTAKPTTAAFTLKEDKKKVFFEKKGNTSADVLKRFDERRAKDGIGVPFKK